MLNMHKRGQNKSTMGEKEERKGGGKNIKT